jgi:hypothetical protein
MISRWRFTVFLSNEGSTAGLDTGAPGSATVVLVQLLRTPDGRQRRRLSGARKWNDDTFRRYGWLAR